ncbi:IS5 family transposase [Alteromonas pelagimontana]|uniref:IS5 family transposase n=1 Tax=Alteromonas pelagimontana TaxID=1858656 RepID=A0A6M4MEU9_9ALTE|nr:IS5 family transposase [Alteromonas pelagimontana]QJR81704.1 IS5 family transposase [Alteromonas pelagimontana]
MGKAKNKISNWSKYNQALVNRGSITFWIDDKAIAAWHCETHHGGRGRGFQFSNTAIETALTIKAVFSLPLRATEGFLNSVFALMKLPCRSPGYSCLSKRAKTVEINYKCRSRGPVAHVVVDATGLKIYGEGEWHAHKHGREKRRRWRKLHVAVNSDTHEVIAAQMSMENVGDNQVLPSLLNPLRRRIDQLSADGAYDTKGCHQLLMKKKVAASIPPRENAGFWQEGHPRNNAVKALKAGKLADWKQESGYHRRSLSETAMYRYKTLVSNRLSLRSHNAQVAEMMVGVKIMNRVIGLSVPVRQETD